MHKTSNGRLCQQIPLCAMRICAKPPSARYGEADLTLCCHDPHKPGRPGIFNAVHLDVMLFKFLVFNSFRRVRVAYLYERLTGIEGCRGFESLRLLIVFFFFQR